MAIEFIKVDLTDHFGITMKPFTKQSSSICSLHKKIRIQSTILFTHQKRKINNFLLKNLPPQNIFPHLIFIISIVLAKF